MEIGKLPPNFEWMQEGKIGTWPEMIAQGVKLVGVKEIPGPNNAPEIMQLAFELGLSNIYKSDDKQAWCAVAHCGIAKRAGKKVSFTDRYDFLRALAFAKQGEIYNLDEWEIVKPEDALFGDTIIIMRPGGGHIGLKIGENKTHIYIMGGNQANQYGFTRVAKQRIFAVRRPKYKVVPPSVKNYILNDTGVPVTTNEQ